MARKKGNRKYGDWLWMIAVVIIMGLLYLSVERKSSESIESISINIKPLKGKQYLITKKDVRKKFTNYLGYDLANVTIEELELLELEELLNGDVRVSRAEVFVDSKERLQIWILQKDPIVRVSNGIDKHYYLDKKGAQIPVELAPAIRVPLATGDIESYDVKLLTSDKKSRLKEVFELSQFVNNDVFLSSLIEQINIDDSGHITLVPKIGRQTVSLGDISDLEDKIENLKIFYKGGMPHIGWRDKSVLKLDYKGQVVKENL